MGLKRKKYDWRNGRLVPILLGLFLISFGGIRLADGIMYKNFWGDPVFPPLFIALGVFVLYLSTFGWQLVSKKPERKRRKESARERRKRRQYERGTPAVEKHIDRWR